MRSPQPPGVRKFSVAIDGMFRSFANHQSFWFHLPAAGVAIAMAAWLRVEPWRWAVVLLVITIVLSAELMNTAIEQLVRVVHPERDERIGHALDAAAAAVLLASIGALAVALITLGVPLWKALTL